MIGGGALDRVEIPLRAGNMDDRPPPTVGEMPDEPVDPFAIVDPQRMAAGAVGTVDQDRRERGRDDLGDLCRRQLRRHCDQPVDPPAHRAQCLRGKIGVGVHRRQQQLIAQRPGSAIHPAHQFREEFAVEVGQDDPDCVARPDAEAARPGMGDIVEIGDCLKHAVAGFSADRGGGIERAGD